MDKIKRAVERARHERQGTAEQVRAASAVPTPVRPLPQAAADENSVQYTQTTVVPLNDGHLQRNRIVAFDKGDPRTGAFDVLRTKILRRMQDKGWRTLAVTSPTAEAGKTVVAINLAMSIAHQTQKTAMLVDFDLRRPKLASYLGLPPGISLNEVLSGDAPLADALVNPGMPRLVVLPAQHAIRKSAETLSSPRVAALVEELRERYEERMVIFDLPPLLPSDDAMAVLPQIDCVLMVVGDGMSSQAEIDQSLRQVPSDKLVGVVLNKSTGESKSYY